MNNIKANEELIKQYLSNVNSLPQKVKAKLILLQSLDEQLKVVENEVESLTMSYHIKFVNNVKTPLSNALRRDKLKSIRVIKEKLRVGKRICDEKLSASESMYQEVDSYICQLDNDLRKFEHEGFQRAAPPSDNSAKKNKISKKTAKKSSKLISMKLGKKEKVKNNFSKRNNKKETAENAAKDISPSPVKIAVMTSIKNKKQISLIKKARLKKSSQNVVSSPSSGDNIQVEAGDLPSSAALTMALTNDPKNVVEMAIDPNEPTYCYCNQVSHGLMVACDNSNCSIEWFHFGCVGLKVSPKGAWFCKECNNTNNSFLT